VNALSQQQVGQYLNRHFVSAFQKVATFQLVNGVQKQGGNVASYFCTPDGRVLHAIAGPVDDGTFLREAKWANETFKLAQIGNPPLAEVQAFFRKAHTDRLMNEHRIPLPKIGLPRPHAVSAKLLDQLLVQNQDLMLGNQGKVHLLLAVGAMPRLDHTYQAVFERILNEKISTKPVEVAGR
jgi:hypothetical protein